MSKVEEIVLKHAELLPSLLSLEVAKEVANDALEWAAQQCEAGAKKHLETGLTTGGCHTRDAQRIRDGKSVQP